MGNRRRSKAKHSKPDQPSQDIGRLQKHKEEFAPWVGLFLIGIAAIAMLLTGKAPEPLENAFLLALGYFFGHTR